MSRKKAESELPQFLKPVEPWPDPVAGDELLSSIRDALLRFMVLPDQAAETVALWVLFAHAHDAAEHSPILAIESPEKRCGKTTLLNIVAKLVPVPLPAANISTAAIYRAVEKFGPTLLLDEVETYIRDNEEMRGVVNSGFTRDSAVVIRNVGDNHEPQPFKTWCPKVAALIGKLPDTLQDRAIIVTLRRRLTSESRERFSRQCHDEMKSLHRRAARWAADHIEELKIADPSMPAGLGDRAQDAWRPLLAIADAAGASWSDIGRRAAVALTGASDDEADSASRGVLLLTHVREIFAIREVQSLQSQDLLDALNNNEEWPWGEWRQGKAISARGVAAILKPYGIRPRRGSAGSSYRLSDFADAFQRYLFPATPPPTATSATDAESHSNIRALKTASSAMRTATDGTKWQFEKPGEPIETANDIALVAVGGGKRGRLRPNGHSAQPDDAELF